MSDYDAMVIGAGNGGLTSALTLASSGLRVLLLERHNIPGGCATSFVRGRFEFEVALHQLSGMGTEAFPGPLETPWENSALWTNSTLSAWTTFTGLSCRAATVIEVDFKAQKIKTAD